MTHHHSPECAITVVLGGGAYEVDEYCECGATRRRRVPHPERHDVDRWEPGTPDPVVRELASVAPGAP